jgi:hypothetical protein|tara:strand:- start:606 stop:944 length:339 start_codon:yes stop_codon:yes gene_type:complete
MIKSTSVLTHSDWKNLHGNDVYVQMLRNKVKVQIEKNTKIPKNSDDLKNAEEDTVFGAVLDYLQDIPADLVYYNVEDVYGHKTVYVYFANPIDKENFIHYYNINLGLEKITN